MNAWGQTYGQVLASPGSGARYASLYDPAAGGAGPERWETRGQGTLSRLSGKPSGRPQVILRACRAR